MRRLQQMVLIGVLVLVSGCMFQPPPPFELKPVMPDLAIAPSQKRLLKIAVVVQDPMPYTMFYQGEGSYSRDSTAEARNRGLLLERDLSRISSETFSQVFSQVVVLRDLPQPGQYDAVVNLNIGQVLLKEKVVLTGETCNLTASWSMSVLDNKNQEIFNKQGTSPVHNFAWSTMNPSATLTLGVNEHLSVILGELAKEWGMTLYTLKIPT